MLPRFGGLDEKDQRQTVRSAVAKRAASLVEFACSRRCVCGRMYREQERSKALSNSSRPLLFRSLTEVSPVSVREFDPASAIPCREFSVLRLALQVLVLAFKEPGDSHCGSVGAPGGPSAHGRGDQGTRLLVCFSACRSSPPARAVEPRPSQSAALTVRARSSTTSIEIAVTDRQAAPGVVLRWRPLAPGVRRRA